VRKFVNGKIPSVISSEAFVHKHLKFNFIVGLIDGGLYGVGIGFGSFMAILPLFVSHMTDSALLIGLIPAIHGAGWQLPQLLTAGYTSRAKRVKPLVLWATIHERVPYLGLAAVAFFLARFPIPLALTLTFLLIIWQSLGAGFAANPWQTMVTKVMPMELHGTFFGTQSAAFNGLAGLAAIAAGFMLEKLPSPWDFTLCFLGTFLFFVLSFIAIAQTRELDSDRPKNEEHPTAFWGHSWDILKRDRNFNAFLVVRSISQFAAMGTSFYLVYAVKELGMGESMAGIMTSVLLISQVVFAPLMGRLGDRWSHRGVMMLGGLGAAASSLLAWTASSVEWFYPVFLLAAIAIVAIWTIPIALTVSFAEEHERPLYIGLSNTISAPATIIAPIIGGWIADAAGYDVMFLVSALCGLLMISALIFLVKEHPKGHVNRL
jgi:MFS family permease